MLECSGLPDSRRSRQKPNADFRDCESFTENWYRFQGAAGTRMPTKCPPVGNSQFPVWLNVESNRLLYKGEGVRTDIKTCFPDCCRIDRHFEISVENCSSYLIYKLGQMTTFYFFFQEGTVTNPAIWLVLSAVRYPCQGSTERKYIFQRFLVFPVMFLLISFICPALEQGSSIALQTQWFRILNFFDRFTVDLNSNLVIRKSLHSLILPNHHK